MAFGWTPELWNKFVQAYKRHISPYAEPERYWRLMPPREAFKAIGKPLPESRPPKQQAPPKHPPSPPRHRPQPQSHKPEPHPIKPKLLPPTHSHPSPPKPQAKPAPNPVHPPLPQSHAQPKPTQKNNSKPSEQSVKPQSPADKKLLEKINEWLSNKISDKEMIKTIREWLKESSKQTPKHQTPINKPEPQSTSPKEVKDAKELALTIRSSPRLEAIVITKEGVYKAVTGPKSTGWELLFKNEKEFWEDYKREMSLKKKYPLYASPYDDVPIIRVPSRKILDEALGLITKTNAQIAETVRKVAPELTTSELDTKEYIVRGYKNGNVVEYRFKTEEAARLKAKQLRDMGYTTDITRPGGIDWKYASFQDFAEKHPNLAKELKTHKIGKIIEKNGAVELELIPKEKPKPKQEHRQPKTQQKKTEPKGLIGGDAGLRVAASNTKHKEYEKELKKLMEEKGDEGIKEFLRRHPEFNGTIEVKGLKIGSFTEDLLKQKQKSIKSDFTTDLEKRAVELQLKGEQTSNPAERLVIGAELAGVGVALGATNTLKGIAEIVKEAVNNPIKAAEDAVKGTVNWFINLPRRVVKALEGNPLEAGKITGEILTTEALGEVGGKVTPKVSRAKVSVLEGSGATPKVESVKYGVTLQVAEKPLITVGKAGAEGKIKVGRVLPAPKKAIEGKTVTAYSPLETEFFKRTVKEYAESPEHVELFEKGYKIAKEVYKTKEPVVKPKKFEIHSENIPKQAKPAVKEAIKSYKGNIEVYGSVPQKLQMGEYMSRTPKDIEVVVDKPEKFVAKLEEKLKKANVEYKIKGSAEKPKVYFKVGDEWVKGIEIFSKKSKEGYLGFGTSIAYGFNKQKAIKVEGVEMLRLSEQAARKLEGGHVFKEGKIQPKHEGRFKDINDLIEIGTAYVKEKGLPIEKEVVEYTKLATKLYGEEIKSPIAKFIEKEGRLPTKEELARLANEAGIEQLEAKELLFKKESMTSSIMSEVPESFKRTVESSIAESSMITKKSKGVIESAITPVESSIMKAIETVESSMIFPKPEDVSSIIPPPKQDHISYLIPTHEDTSSIVPPAKPPFEYSPPIEIPSNLNSQIELPSSFKPPITRGPSSYIPSDDSSWSKPTFSSDIPSPHPPSIPPQNPPRLPPILTPPYKDTTTPPRKGKKTKLDKFFEETIRSMFDLDTLAFVNPIADNPLNVDFGFVFGGKRKR